MTFAGIYGHKTCSIGAESLRPVIQMVVHLLVVSVHAIGASVAPACFTLPPHQAVTLD
uniref:Uncharacterized protein n=1 Tax=Arundo donax TaxID=35708 RepID=A0A0A9A610_ARUDO